MIDAVASYRSDLATTTHSRPTWWY